MKQGERYVWYKGNKTCQSVVEIFDPTEKKAKVITTNFCWKIGEIREVHSLHKNFYLLLKGQEKPE